MSNLRILQYNALEGATLTASSTAGVKLGVANLTTYKKSDVWRANTKTERLDAVWPAPVPIGVVYLWGNLSGTSTWRVRLTNEAQATNLLKYSNDFTNAAWTRLNLAAPVTGVAGPNGTNSATTLTASAANGEIYQTAANVGAAAASIWIRRRTGAGAVSIRNTANTAWTPLALTGSWARFTNDGGTNASTARLDILIATSGDAIDIAFAQAEPGSVATSYYPTTGAAATRPLGYIDSWQSYSYDSGSVTACSGPGLVPRPFTAAQAASAYAYNGGNTALLWLPAVQSAVGMAVDIADPNNLQSSLEAVFWVAGDYYQTHKNADYGASAQPVDRTKVEYSQAGDQIRTLGTRGKKLSFTLSKMDPTDRATVWDYMSMNGTGFPFLLCIFPQDADAHLERTHTIWGTLVETASMGLPSFNIAAATLFVQSL